MIHRPLAPYVIAEVAGNHGGDLGVAVEMIRVAAECGADMVKFQKRDVEKSRQAWEKIPRTDAYAFGANEYEHRKALEFSYEQHLTLMEECKKSGVLYGCSAWDQESFDFLAKAKLVFIKIPSAKNEEFLWWSRGAYPQVHISLGMTDEAARVKILNALRPTDVPYACTSKYPCEANETFLGEVGLLATMYTRVGFSGHHKGIALDVAAYTLGATYIERHFTLDRTSKGTDHAASLEPDGLRKLCRDLCAVQLAMKCKPQGDPPCEAGMITKFKGSGR